MIRFVANVLLFLMPFSILAQKNIEISGTIHGSVDKKPIASATVYLSMAKDSTLLQYTITDNKGNFEIKTNIQEQAVFLKISALGFEEIRMDFPKLNSSKKIPLQELLPEMKHLNEVVIKAQAPPIRIKKDTLEFNANSFKMRPDANVEALLKQLPGVEVDKDGKITVNGKVVDKILVNGKPFFGKDGKIALQSLPAEIIQKVQVSDSKTRKEELTKQAAKSNEASINLTIDEKKHKGFFGQAMAGYGSNQRYDSNAMINYFKGKRKISVLASSNNINNIGFSMDDVFDGMGGGRASRGNVRAVSGGKSNGISRTNLVGVNYSDEWAKDMQATTSYDFSDTQNETRNRTNEQFFIPPSSNNPNGSEFLTKSTQEGVSNTENHQLKGEYQLKKNEKYAIFYEPNFSYVKNKSNQVSQQFSEELSGNLLNESASNAMTDGWKQSFANNLTFNKTFLKKGRFLHFNLETSNEKNNQDVVVNSRTISYKSGAPADIRNQQQETETKNDSYFAVLSYIEPLKDSLSLRFSMNYSVDKNADKRMVYDFDTQTNEYTIFNDLLSNQWKSTLTDWTPEVSLAFNNGTQNAQIVAGTSFKQLNGNAFYIGNETLVNKNYIFPNISANYNYGNGKKNSTYLYYNLNNSLPNITQLMPIENLANPLNTIVGNEDLKPTQSHVFGIYFRRYDFQTKTGFNISFNGNYNVNGIASTVIYDEDRKRRTTYQNISDTYGISFGGSYNKMIKKEAHSFRFSAGIRASFDLNKGFIDGNVFDSKIFGVRPRVDFTYEYGEVLSINPSYSISFNDTRYTNYTTEKISNNMHTFNLQSTAFWSENWMFGSDFGYTYNSNIAPGFKKDFYLLNLSLAYRFLDKKWMAKIKMYDVLNQNQSATRTLTATGVRDAENLVLRQYAMFSLTYKLNAIEGKQNKKKKQKI